MIRGMPRSVFHRFSAPAPTSKNPHSTVGTVTEIYDYLRLLYARIGIPYSPATGLPIESQTVSQMVDRIMGLPEGARLL
jgi:excinuclease ABC subunit A